MRYQISLKSPLTHLVSIEYEIESNDNHEEFKLPIWRPGRYEAANYAKNIQAITFEDEHGLALSYNKINHSTWSVTSKTKKIIAKYIYYAHQMDAGNSWYSTDQLYLNFINCLIYSKNHISEQCEVVLDIPENYDIACGLKKTGKVLYASDYYQLVDSPVIASPGLQRIDYICHDLPFRIWMQGKHSVSAEKLKTDFKKFTDYQLEVMGEFPEGDYHFLNQITSYKHYHGVEHGNSTVICIGPGDKLDDDSLYEEFLGVSSHELFHAWNVLKIRPKELLPYDFNQPANFDTGYVVEGFTTYYGDLVLAQSHVFDQGWYFEKLNKLFERHFHNYGRLTNSVIDSCIDLWVDGYQSGAPNKKSSIYVEGAMIALTLDLLIRQNTGNEGSLDDVMRLLWKRFGKTKIGYDSKDVQKICEQVFGGDLSGYFEDYVDGVKPKENLLNDLLQYVGCQLKIEENDNVLERELGIKATISNDKLVVTQIQPESLGEELFSLRDKVLKINGQDSTNDKILSIKSDQMIFQIERNFEVVEFKADFKSESYFKKHTIAKLANPSKVQKDSFKNWLKSDF